MRINLLCLLLCFCLKNFGNRSSDSLIKIIKGSDNDSLKVMAYFSLAGVYHKEPTKALDVLAEMNLFCEGKIKNQHLKALCLRKLGVMYGNLNFPDKALEYTFKSAELFEQLGDKVGLANCYNNIGSFYNKKGEFTNDAAFYKRSIEYHLKAIDIRTLINDTSQLCNSYNNIGGAYLSTNNYIKALEYFNKAFLIYSRYNDFNAMEMINTNLGDCYLMIGKKENNKGFLKQSLQYNLKVIKNYHVKNPNDRYAGAFASAGEAYMELGNVSQGFIYLNTSLELGQKIHNKNSIMLAAQKLAKAYQKNGDCNKALEFMNVYNLNKDSLINEKNSHSIEEMQAIYQSSQKDKEINKLNNEKLIKDAELSRQRTIILSSIAAVISIFFVVLVLLSRNNLKKKANLKLTDAYHKIELKNQQITDSINYSKRIQSAILPPIELVSKDLKDFFIYYSPKDIVSGDFYWFSNHNNFIFFIVVDCTGHGVPGALMSMIGNTLLNEIINQKNISEPGDILNDLNKGVKNALRQSGSDQISQDDGMDVSICRIDKHNPTVIHYACANHSIFVKTNNKVLELTGDIYSIGGDFGSSVKKFETKTLNLDSEAMVVMSTDGYYDQFGGTLDSKFLVTRFEELILKTDFGSGQISDKFSRELSIWKGSKKQTDDILVAGFKI